MPLSMALAADNLLTIPFDGKKLEVNFSRGSKKLDIELIRNGQRRSFFNETFDINNPSNIDAHIAQITSSLQAQGVSSDNIESVVNLFEEFKFVSTSNCQAIHLGEELTSDTRVIEDLVSEFDRISAGIRGEGDFERSIELFELNVPDVGKIQLRALVDRHGNPIRLSLSQAGGSLRDFTVERNGDSFILSTQDGRQILKVKNHNMDSRLVSIYSLGREGLETEARTHLRLESIDDSLIATIIASSERVERERVGAVQLTSISIQHSPVIRNAQMNIFIPSLDVDTLREKIQSHPFGSMSTSLDTFNSRVQNVYDSCLSEAYVLRRELSYPYSDTQLSDNCLLRTGLEMADISLGENEVQQRELRACLVESGLLYGEGSQRRYNDDYIYSGDYTKVEDCENRVEENALRIQLSLLVENSFLRQDESFAPLSVRVTEMALESFRQCEGANCQAIALNKARAEIYKLNFLNWFNESIPNKIEQREELVRDFNECISSPQSFDSCRIAIVSSTVEFLPDTMYENILAEAGLSEVAISDTDKRDINSCVRDNLGRVDASNFTSLDEWRYRCSFNRLKELLPQLTSQYWSRSLSDYQVQSPVSNVVDFVNSSMAQIQSVADAKNIIDQSAALAYASAFNSFVTNRLNERLPIENTGSVYEAAAQEEVRDNLAAITDPGTIDLNEGSAAFLRSAAATRGLDGVKTAFNDIIMRAHIQPRAYELASNLGAAYNDTDLAPILETLTSEYEECWQDYDANSESNVLDYGIQCDKQSIASEEFALVAQQLRQYVSRRFPLSSQEANEILSPLYYLDKCYRDGDPLGEKSVYDYRRWVNACSAVSRVDIASNLFEKLREKYNPVLNSGDQSLLASKMVCFTAPLKSLLGENSEQWFKPSFVAPAGLENSRSIDDIVTASNALVGAGSILSAMFPSENFDQRYKESDRTVLQGYLSSLSNIEESSLDSLMTSLEACASQFNQSLSTGFRSYLIESVPNLFSRLSSTLSQEQNQILQEVIDVELAQLLLQVQAKNEYRVIPSDGPGAEIVTSEFTIQALARFIEGVGQYISQGFVFDLDEMKTELAVFKEELKDALTWVVESPEPVSLSELSRFFSESRLADHMALAHVSKTTDENFQAFLSSMYDQEIADFWERVRDSNSGFLPWILGRDTNHLSTTQRREHTEIVSKYSSLKNLSHRMTASYDFRRIFNLHNSQGRATLDLIMENEFLPRIAGRVPSATNRDEVSSAIAQRILADNTAGGFAERFVREMAQEYLTKQSRSKWGITKWLFYDSGDFDWEVIRDTPSGQRAINYYGRYVLLPKMLGQNVSRYQENIHKRRFEALLREAQSEN